MLKQTSTREEYGRRGSIFAIHLHCHFFLRELLIVLAFYPALPFRSQASASTVQDGKHRTPIVLKISGESKSVRVCHYLRLNRRNVFVGPSTPL